MDLASNGRPPTRRRRALEDTPLRANRAQHGYSARHGDKLSLHTTPTSSPQNLPHNESLVPNGTLAVRHAQPAPSPQHKRVSAVIEESRPRNPKRDSEVSNSSHASTGGRRKTHIGPWQLGKTIGKGGCSRVRIVRHSGTGQYGAAKIISKATADKVRALSLANLADSAQHDPSLIPHGKVIPFGLEREICIMKLLNHPNIVHLYDIWENRNELYLIMEYVEGGELFSYMSEHGALPEIEVVHIFRQIIAALYYCHRINIHHRDLKPENILLDRENMQIKLVDFGMAALQPYGKKLTTPCGSPHYAAPEVIAMRPYDGGTADIWSCGVILYVLLTGTPPFNYSGDDDHLKHLFRAISKADYVMPDGLSKEARDLIRRILTVNPRHRITIGEIWNHGLLHKYDRELNNIGENASIGNWVGPELQLNDWQMLSPNTIDREILRYMRTLWHSEKESKLIQRLVSKECNYEKYFYSALKQYQHDQLENYTPSPYQPLAYSKSDYHHNGRYAPANANASGESSQNQIHTRTQSGYSILNNEHLYSKHSFYGAPSSEASYDPYKASKVPIIPNHSNHRHVTVHRGSSSSSASQKHRPATAMGRHNSSLRIQVMKKNSKRSSAVSRKSSMRSNTSQRTASVTHGSVSRTSLSSSVFPSSPPAFMVGRGSRRVVNFSRSLPHMRGSSAVTVGTAAGGSARNTPPMARYSSRGGASVVSSAQSPNSSTIGDSPFTRPLPKVAAKPGPRLRLRDPESPTKYITTEVKKVSTELSKVMDEAFNRRSTDSSVRASTIEVHQDCFPFETPPTSISNRDSGGTALDTPGNKSSYQTRPLPPTPTETPNTYMYRNIESLRAEMAQKFAPSGEHTEHMSLILQKLGEFEQMLRSPPPVANPALARGMRISSAPARSAEQPIPLHVIPEELKSDSDERLAPPSSAYRAFTDPVRPVLQGRRAATAQSTIRVVDSSPTRIEPLNIRKKSGASMPRGIRRNEDVMPWVDATTVSPMTSHEVQDSSQVSYSQLEPLPAPLPVIEPNKPVVKKKKSSWFRRNADKERTQENHLKIASAKVHIPERFIGLDDRLKNDLPRFVDANKQSNASDSTEFPIRNCGTAFGKSEGGGPFKGFLGLFAKKSKERLNRHALELADNFSTSSIFQGSEAESDRESLVQPNAREYQTNWLSRFLHIKPANRVLCFKGRRPQIRRVLLRQLRAWEHNGLKDVSYKNQVVTARVDKINDLNFKPVSFVIEFFVVLQHGSDTDVCLVRFTQTAGSATGFRKAADRIEQLYRDRGLLVENEEEKATICEMLN